MVDIFLVFDLAFIPFEIFAAFHISFAEIDKKKEKRKTKAEEKNSEEALDNNTRKKIMDDNFSHIADTNTKIIK